MTIRATSSLLLLLLAGACDTARSPESSSTAAGLPATAETTDSLAKHLLAATDGDSAWLVSRDESNILRWSSARSARAWESTSLYGAVPRVRLVDLNADGAVDLFYAMEYEEFIFGKVIARDGAGFREMYSTNVSLCGAPRLEDVNGDGKLDILEPRPTALSAEECREDPAATVCRAALSTDWIELLQQSSDGTFRPDSSHASAFYQSLAEAYASSVRVLRRDLETGSGLAAGSSRCNSEMLKSIEAMEARARGLSSTE